MGVAAFNSPESKRDPANRKRSHASLQAKVLGAGPCKLKVEEPEDKLARLRARLDQIQTEVDALRERACACELEDTMQKLSELRTRTSRSA